MTSWSRRALALHLRWALADALCSGVMVGWALSPDWGWCCHPLIRQSWTNHMKPAPTPRTQQSSLEGPPRTTAHMWRC